MAAWPDGIRHLIATARARGTVHHGLVELARSGPAPLAEAFERYPALARMAGPVPDLEAIREDLEGARDDGDDRRHLSRMPETGTYGSKGDGETCRFVRRRAPDHQ